MLQKPQSKESPDGWIAERVAPGLNRLNERAPVFDGPTGLGSARGKMQGENRKEGRLVDLGVEYGVCEGQPWHQEIGICILAFLYCSRAVYLTRNTT